MEGKASEVTKRKLPRTKPNARKSRRFTRVSTTDVPDFPVNTDRNSGLGTNASPDGVGEENLERTIRQTRRNSSRTAQANALNWKPARANTEDTPTEEATTRRIKSNLSRGSGFSSSTLERQERSHVDEEEVNKLKNEVSSLSANLNRTRDTLMATVEMHIKRIKELEKEVAQKNALCESLKRPSPQDCACSRSSSSAKKKSRMDGIEDRFQSVARSVFNVLRDEASDIVRELVPANGSVLRDWTGKVLMLPSNEPGDGKGLLRIGGMPAVPKCPMEMALKGEIYTKPDSIANTLVSIIDGTLQESPPGVFDENEKRLCLARLSTYKPLRSWFSRVLSEEASTLKLTLRCAFFEQLGYLHIKRTAKDKNEKPNDREERRKEQDYAMRTLLKLNEDNLPDFATWRISTDENIRYREVGSEEDDMPPDDIFFKNQAAKSAFFRFRNHEHEHRQEGDSHATILSLARADAWIAVTVKMFSKQEGKGGKRNNEFKKLFQSYLPLALEAILDTVRSVVVKEDKGEIKRVLDNMPSTKTSYTDDRRSYTQVIRMPGANLDYLAVQSQFMSSLSPILGEVKDCYIGRCSPAELTFKPILAKDSGHYEASDVEEDKEEISAVQAEDDLDLDLDDDDTDDAEIEDDIC